MWTPNLRKTYDEIEAKLRALEGFNEQINNNTILFSEVSQKFPFDAITQLDLGEEDSLSELRTQLDKFIKKREKFSYNNSNQPFHEVRKKNFSKSSTEALLSNEQSKKCIYCQENHWSDQCTNYTTIADRKEKIKGNCFICFKSNHSAKQCESLKICVYCKKKSKHHRSLCPEKFKPGSTKKETKTDESASTTTNATLLSECEDGALLVTSVKFGPVITTIILDTGSKRTYITNNLASKMRCKILGHEVLQISTFGNDCSSVRSKMVELDIPVQNGLKIKITANTVPKIAGRISSPRANQNEIVSQKYPSLKLAEYDENLEPEILIGNDFSFDFLTMEKLPISDSLNLIGSLFGWFIVGRFDIKNNHTETPIFYNDVKRLWELDNIGLNDYDDKAEDDIAVESFYQNIRYDADEKRYSVSWPWKEYPPDLKTNYGLALGRLSTLKKSLDKDKKLFQQYDEVIKLQEEKGIIEKVDDKDSKNDLVHYLPHHPVITPDVIELYKESKDIFNDASMNLRAWNSNCKNLKNELLKGDDSGNTIVSVLGLKWDILSDTFEIKHNLPSTSVEVDSITKRYVVKIVSSIFDPLGYLCPVLLLAKIFIQNLWKENIDWDCELSVDDRVTWESLHVKLNTISSVKIARFIDIDLNVNGNVELHCFVDASKTAYAAVIYLKGQNGTRFIMAKSKLAPKHGNLTIPKLELLALYVGSKLMTFVTDCLSESVKIVDRYIWSDSKCVLYWLKSKRVLPRFVEKTIKLIDKNVHFRYVPSSNNPADIASRGAEIGDFNSSFWWSGPDWLKNAETCWPKNDLNISDSDGDIVSGDEVQQEINLNIEIIEPPFKIDYCNFTDLGELFKTTMEKSKENLSAVCILWLKFVQRKYYGKVIHSIKNKIHHELQRQFDLKLDQNDTLRCAGRLANSDLKDDEKYPILLPEKDYLTQLIIEKIHRDNFHVGVSHTLLELRKMYWVPKGRSTVYKILRKCENCLFYGGKTYSYPDPSPLPKEQVTRSCPFSGTGIDTFGPLYIEKDDNTIKVFGCIFTCMTTRAVHLELLIDMTTYEFVLVLRKFFALRGVPSHIVTDNAAQFKLIKSMLDETSKNCHPNEKTENLTSIDWKFIPELSPWHGGFYERLIGMVKNCLKKSFFKVLLSYTQMQTVLAEIAFVLNSRPSVYLGEEDRNVISPNDLLILKFVSLPNIDSNSKRNIDIVELWKRSNRLLDEFWYHWRHQYLSNLRERNNYIAKKKGIDVIPKVGDVVLIEGEKKFTPRGEWRIGKVIGMNVSADGKIRSVLLETEKSKLTRPINKLYPLETS
ncbi:uncharacterized protein LOC135833647 [Planococcus citri]|uniref:uncharacterized protein LOC135833647 n=1 Tax=Planococcus citri TaxID=170843 RepID=UPI0031F8BECB